jgi:hypothetical protein
MSKKEKEPAIIKGCYLVPNLLDSGHKNKTKLMYGNRVLMVSKDGIERLI